jgi:hypothetical protein
LHSDEVLTESFWGPDFPNEDPGNSDDCGLMVVEMDNFWWEDSSCLASEVHQSTVAVICQYDVAVTSTTTTISAASTTTSIPETTTVTITTTEVFTTTTVTTTVTPDTSCPSGWQNFEGHCYIVIAAGPLNYVTWAYAEKDCNNKGGHLASIHSDAENYFIFNLWSASGNVYMWIGGTDAEVEVGFKILKYM